MIITLTKWSDFWVACWDLKKKNTATAGGGLEYAAIQKRRCLVYFCFFLLAHWILFRALPWIINMGCGLVWSGGICVFQKRHPASRPGHYCTRLHRTLFFYILYFLCKIYFLCHLFPLFVYARSLRKTFLDLKYFLCQNTLFNSTSPKFITLTQSAQNWAWNTQLGMSLSQQDRVSPLIQEGSWQCVIKISYFHPELKSRSDFPT